MREEEEGNLGNIGRGNNFYWEWWECPIHHSLAVIGDGKGRGGIGPTWEWWGKPHSHLPCGSEVLGRVGVGVLMAGSSGCCGVFGWGPLKMKTIV